jgi:Plasmid pRiA4b ORF-3-like protein
MELAGSTPYPASGPGSMSATSSVARLKIMLDDVTPAVVRVVEVPLNIRLDRLHTIFQKAMGWTDSHLWEFRFRGTGFGMPDPDDGFGGSLDARKTTLKAAIEDCGARSFLYMYDFGDAWEHSVKIEAITPSHPQLSYPRIVKASGCCPPEDIGGPWGYAQALEAYANPEHEEYEFAIEQIGKDFDPVEVDILAINDALTHLASKWTPKPRRKA